MQLTLFLAKNDDKKWLKQDRNLESVLFGAIQNNYGKLWPLLRLDDTRCVGPQFDIDPENVHILVEVASKVVAVKPRAVPSTLQAIPTDNDIGLRRLWKYSELYSTKFPPACEIAGILQRPLGFRLQLWDEAVGAQIFAPHAPKVECKALSCWLQTIWENLKAPVYAWLPPRSWLDIYNQLLRVVELLCSANEFHTWTHCRRLGQAEVYSSKERPDAVFVVNRLIVLGANVQGVSSNIAASCAELTSMIRIWNPMFYGDMPYILGIAASGPMLRILAIDRKLHYTTIMEFQSILEQIPDVVKAFYNLAFVLGQMRTSSHVTCQSRVLPFRPKASYTGTVMQKLEILDDRVVRTIECNRRSKLQDFKRLVDIYRSFQRLGATSHLQTVTKLELSEIPTQRVVAQLSPLGFHRHPVDVPEAHEWLRGILTALKYWHGSHYCHGDVCWKNILYASSIRPSCWFLIGMGKSQKLERKRTCWKRSLRDDKLSFGQDLFQLGNMTNILHAELTLPDALLRIRDALVSARNDLKLTAKGVLEMLENAQPQVELGVESC